MIPVIATMFACAILAYFAMQIKAGLVGGLLAVAFAIIGSVAISFALFGAISTALVGPGIAAAIGIAIYLR